MHVVLIEPEIPFNAGNAGRTCAAAGAALHLVGRLGFRLDSKEIRRSGLDYWPRVKLRRHADLEAFQAALPPGAPVFLFSAKARRSLWEAPFRRGSWLVFGNEAHGLPAELLARFPGRDYRIPMRRGLRSLNLSTSVAVALYEALRATRRGGRRPRGEV